MKFSQGADPLVAEGIRREPQLHEPRCIAAAAEILYKRYCTCAVPYIYMHSMRTNTSIFSHFIISVQGRRPDGRLALLSLIQTSISAAAGSITLSGKGCGRDLPPPTHSFLGSTGHGESFGARAIKEGRCAKRQAVAVRSPADAACCTYAAAHVGYAQSKSQHLSCHIRFCCRYNLVI